jgi:hypothetical protein
LAVDNVSLVDNRGGFFNEKELINQAEHIFSFKFIPKLIDTKIHHLIDDNLYESLRAKHQDNYGSWVKINFENAEKHEMGKPVTDEEIINELRLAGVKYPWAFILDFLIEHPELENILNKVPYMYDDQEEYLITNYPSFKDKFHKIEINKES